MSINRISIPEPTEGSMAPADWAKVVEKISTKYLSNSAMLLTSGTNIVQGSVFNIADVIYLTDADTAISGTESDYVKLTPNSGDSGATADASFVADLTGVAWNKDYNGYYDSSNNLYIFNEMNAYKNGDTTIFNTKGVNLNSDNYIDFIIGDNSIKNTSNLVKVPIGTVKDTLSFDGSIGTATTTGTCKHNDSEHVYILIGSILYKYLLSTGERVSTEATGIAASQMIAYDPVTGYLVTVYGGTNDRSVVYVYNPASNYSLVTTFNAPGYAGSTSGITFDENGNLIFITSYGYPWVMSIYICNGISNSVLSSFVSVYSNLGGYRARTITYDIHSKLLVQQTISIYSTGYIANHYICDGLSSNVLSSFTTLNDSVNFANARVCDFIAPTGQLYSLLCDKALILKSKLYYKEA